MTTVSAAPTPAPPVEPPRSRRLRARYLVAGAILLGALGFLLWKGLGTALNYYLPANQAMQQRASLGDRTFNLEGLVEPGSIHNTAHGVTFTVGAGSTRVHVVNTGDPPQLFHVNIPVIAVGHFDGQTFVSNQILVKHSSTYIAAHPTRVAAPNGSQR